MNRIYLFLAALLACFYTASAYDNVKLNINDSGSWKTYDMEQYWEGSSERYKYTFTVSGTNCEFNITSSSHNWGGNKYIGLTDNSNLLTRYSTGTSYTSPHFNFGAGTYTMYFNPGYKSDHSEAECWIQSSGGGGGGSTGDYYFYGDMNLWSASDNAGQKVKVYADDTKSKDLASQMFGANIPTYYSTKELENWKFKKVEAGSKYETYLKNTAKVTDPTNYYYLDFANLADPEGHKGRLCGQFKITMGDHGNADNWGSTGGDDNTGYYGWALEANSSEAYVPQKGEGKQNMQLEANAVENAVLYFKRNGDTDANIYLQGTPQYYYVYYGVVGGAATSSGLNWKMVRNGQQNYYLNNAGFDGTSMTTTGGNPKSNGTYTWETITTSTASDKLDANNGSQYLKNGKINYNGLEFTQVIRRRIPSGATHRFPVPLTVTFSDADGKYPETQVNCQDIWFINTANASGINVFFRYDDDAVTESLNWAAYNIFNYEYDKNIRSGYNYLFGGSKAFGAAAPSITNGEYAVMQLVDHVGPEGVSHKWWRSAADIPLDFTTNSWVIFGESRGGVYPVDRVEADRTDLVDVQMNGQNLYYVATTKENPSLLYSHLNGTFKLETSENKTVQINAEFFDPETGGIMTNMGEVTYRYEIWYNGGLVEHSSNPDATDDDGFIDAPFYNWVLNDITNPVESDKLDKWGPGYYYVVVKAKYNGKVYTAQDTYAIY